MKTKRRTKTLPAFLTDDETKRLLSLPNLGGRDRAILEVLVATGLRASELLALDARDIAADRLLVRSGKGGKPRFVPLTERAGKALQAPLSRCSSPSSPVFTNAWGDRLSRRGLYGIVRSHLRAAGLKGSPHRLRHTAATSWLNRGVGLRSVQSALGHAHIGTTARYLGVATDALVAEFRRCLQ